MFIVRVSCPRWVYLTKVESAVYSPLPIAFDKNWIYSLNVEQLINIKREHLVNALKSKIFEP